MKRHARKSKTGACEMACFTTTNVEPQIAEASRRSRTATSRGRRRSSFTTSLPLLLAAVPAEPGVPMHCSLRCSILPSVPSRSGRPRTHGDEGPSQSVPPAAEPGSTSTALFKAIGGKVRTARLDQHLTLDQLSARSGVSRRMITMLEAGETNASLGTLDKLARALDLDFAALVAVRPLPALTPEATRSVQPVWEDGRGSSARLLDSRASARIIELWHWELVGGARYEAVADPPGTEGLLLVDSGRLVAEVGGARYSLEEGQYLRLPSDRPYAYMNPGRKLVRFTRVVVIP